MKYSHILRVGLINGQTVEFGFHDEEAAEKCQSYIATAMLTDPVLHVVDAMGRMATIRADQVAFAVAIDIAAEVTGMIHHHALAEATKQKTIASLKSPSLVVPRAVMLDPNGRSLVNGGH